MHTSMSTIWLPLVVLALLIMGAVGWWWRHRQALAQEQAAARVAQAVALSTVQGLTVEPSSTSQPQAALVLGSVERKAYRLLREAFPRAEVLAHVQLLRFIRLPPRDQRESWLQGANVLDVDLLLCDGRFRVLAAVDVRTRRDTPAGKERNERMAQVLHAAGISVHLWHEESLPSVAEIRNTIKPALVARKAQARATEAANAIVGTARAEEAASTPAGAPDTQPGLLTTPLPRSELSILERAATTGRPSAPRTARGPET